MTGPNPIVGGRYSHDVLIHDNDRELIAGTAAFVEQGLSAGGQVLVHSSEERVAMLRSILGSHPRLEYGLDSELYLSPMDTLFRYERSVAERQSSADLWVTGTVPFGPDVNAHPAWTRYESLVNEVLGKYPFHALCTYDTRELPASTIAAARATHPCLSTGLDRVASTEYLDPAAFLTDPRAAVPGPPQQPPSATSTLGNSRDLRGARHLIARIAVEASAVARDAIDGFVSAVNEVLVNALQHGMPPVQLTVWAETAKLTCLVTDEGLGVENPLCGYQHPGIDGAKGLWLARHLCEELIIGQPAPRRCSVLMTTG